MLYRVFLIGQLLLTLLLAPGVTAGAIAAEVERGTFEQLSLTGLPPRQLVKGKYLGTVTPLLLMVLSGLPVTAMATLCGGVAWQAYCRGVC